ncbi:MAG: peptidase M50 [Ruminococcaceae bacterium]|nr:peptidase M50 [Oscillospiraceae bacterium]
MLRWGRVEVTGGFLLLMAWLNYCDTQGLLPLGVCAAVAHEAGHWLAIRLWGGRMGRLRLSAVGAQMQMVGILSYPAELCCALAGPAVNFLLGYGAARLGWLVFAGMNLALGMFNLLPIGALDGGRVLRCVLAIAGRPDSAMQVQMWLDRVLAMLLSALGITIAGKGGGLMLSMIGGWVLLSSLKIWAEKWRKKVLSRGLITGKMVCTDTYRLDA